MDVSQPQQLAARVEELLIRHAGLASGRSGLRSGDGRTTKATMRD